MQNRAGLGLGCSHDTAFARWGARARQRCRSLLQFASSDSAQSVTTCRDANKTINARDWHTLFDAGCGANTLRKAVGNGSNAVPAFRGSSRPQQNVNWDVCARTITMIHCM